MKAFLAALTLGALALLVVASAASSAKPSVQHYMIGFGHSPNAADAAMVKSHGGTVRQSFASIGVLAVDLPSNQVNDVKQSAGVSYIEADPVRKPLSLSSDLQTSEYQATATNGLYGLVTTHSVEAQAAGFKGTGIKACVADTGLDTRHPDIEPNLVNTHDVFKDTTGPHAADVFDLGVETTETHATHVSGIMLGAVNGVGIHGVAPEARLYEARVLGTQPDGVTVEGETSQVMAGVQWLADQGCKVINMSLGGGDRSQSEEALYNAVRKDGTLIVTLGDRNQRQYIPNTKAQIGKLVRINRDGSIPEDNPFVGKAGYRPEVFSMGHRDQLGLTIHPTTGAVLTAEHGPNGGDEVNVILPGRNYGWPKWSYGRSYEGPRWSETPLAPGIEQPLMLWIPSIAPTGLMIYTGDRFPSWKGNLFVGSARRGEVPRTGGLERVVITDKMEELRRETLLTELHQRIRDVRQGPDGLIYVVTDEDDGALLRLEPQSGLEPGASK